MNEYDAEEQFLQNTKCPVCGERIYSDNNVLDDAHYTSVGLNWSGRYKWFCGDVPLKTHRINYCHNSHKFIKWNRDDTTHSISQVILSAQEIKKFVNYISESENDIINFIISEGLCNNMSSETMIRQIIKDNYSSFGLDVDDDYIDQLTEYEKSYELYKKTHTEIHSILRNHKNIKSLRCMLGYHKYIKNINNNKYLMVCECGKLKLNYKIILNDVVGKSP